MKQKLVFFYFGNYNFSYGVAEVYRHLISGINRENYEIYVIYTGTLTAPLEKLSEKAEIIELHKHGLKKSFFSVINVLKKIQPEIVISAMEHPNVMMVLAKIISRGKFKLVLTSHGILSARLSHMWNRRQGGLVRRAIQLTYPRADKVVCVSKAVLEDLKVHITGMENGIVIHNPVLNYDALPELNLEKEKGLIVTSSRLTKLKNIDEAIRALKFIDDRFHLVILGDGAERVHLKALVEKLELGKRVKFKGYVGDPFTWYKKAEIFVLPSMWEGFGNVMIESMACGCQVVANTSAWSPPEVLGYGEYGFLYEGGDPQNLALAILNAVNNPKSINKIVNYAHSFNHKRIAIEYERVFKNLN